MAVSLAYHDRIVLYVDDEPENLRTFEYALAAEFRVLTARSAQEALATLRQEDVAVLLSDQRMPDMTGVELCERARVLRPDAVRMLMTAYADVGDAIDAINRGQVSRYFAKPWRIEDISEALTQAIEQRDTERRMRALGLHLLGASALGTLFAQHAHELLNALRTLSHHFERAEAALAELDVDRTAEELRRAHTVLDLGTALGIRMRHGMFQTSSPAPCDAASIVETTARLVDQASGLPWRIRVAIPGHPLLRIDATALASVVFNLVSNAVHAIREAGDGATGEISVALLTHGRDAVLTVRDTGPGIAPEHLAHVFEHGFTTRPDGTGLGLAVVRNLVESAGGNVRVESDPGGGATFEVVLPIDSE